MIDTRNAYRAVSRMTNNGEMWKVQCRRWWLPIWLTVDAYNASSDRARECAMNHAKRPHHVRRVVTFGKFPESNR